MTTNPAQQQLSDRYPTISFCLLLLLVRYILTSMKPRMQENGAASDHPPELIAAGSDPRMALDEINKDITPRITQDIHLIAAFNPADHRR
jgi:hypothetical protein